MITLSEFLNTIPFPDNAYSSVQMAIREAKRLEALDVPRNETKRKPLVDGGGNESYIVVDENGIYVNWQLTQQYADNYAHYRTEETGHPHTACRVMAPVNGECPTIPVVTYTPQRPHEWVIYRDKCEYRGRWYATRRRIGGYWAYDLPSKDIQRFPTADEAQDYIDENDIADAYPWPVPKLTS